MIGLKNSYEIAYNGTENECRFELYADTAAEMVGITHYDGIKIQMGSEFTDISTGDRYLLNGSGVWVLQPSDRTFSNVYTKAEIDSMITEIYGIIAYYHTTLISETGEIEFYSLGGNVGTWAIYGNGSQSGTPTPDAPIQPTFCGMLDGTDWKTPLTCAGQTTHVYLGQTQTVRRIKKLVLDGTESWSDVGGNAPYRVSIADIKTSLSTTAIEWYCSHYLAVSTDDSWSSYNYCISKASTTAQSLQFRDTRQATLADFKAYLASEYAAGHPVTIWYVLAKPETAIVNEPLAKIGTYADELHSEDAGVTIPTAKGSNTLTVDTELKPSRIEIQGGYHA